MEERNRQNPDLAGASAGEGVTGGACAAAGDVASHMAGAESADATMAGATCAGGAAAEKPFAGAGIGKSDAAGSAAAAGVNHGDSGDMRAKANMQSGSAGSGAQAGAGTQNGNGGAGTDRYAAAGMMQGSAGASAGEGVTGGACAAGGVDSHMAGAESADATMAGATRAGGADRQEAPLLVCRGLEKRYGARQALRGIDLQLERGCVVGLLGPNGSGKTTLIKLANGLLCPSAGEIRILGAQPGVQTKRVVSYLPDRMYLERWMRVRDVCTMFSDFYTDFDEVKAYEMLSALKIQPSDRIGALSKGTCEKVQLILVMSRQAELYLLDEPIGGVDPAARDYILRTIVGNYRENATVVISTHLIGDVETILDDVVFINQGKIVLHASVDAIREKSGRSVDGLFREVFKC